MDPPAVQPIQVGAQQLGVALVVLDMAMLIGPDEPAVAAAIPEGRAILETLGAEPLLTLLSAADQLRDAPDVPIPASVPAPGISTSPSTSRSDES